jgi:hypothetical protein
MTAYGKIFSGGYRHLILGRIIILLVNQATPGLQRGSFRATRSQNGKRLRVGVPFYGSKGNVRQCLAFTLLPELKISFS